MAERSQSQYVENRQYVPNRRNAQVVWRSSRMSSRGWLLTGALAVVTAGWGLLDPGIYHGLIAPATLPGAFSQDLIAVIVGLVLCGLALGRPRIGTKSELVALGLLGYLFYGYGIYAIPTRLQRLVPELSGALRSVRLFVGDRIGRRGPPRR
jgi:hypothetical protein